MLNPQQKILGFFGFFSDFFRIFFLGCTKIFLSKTRLNLSKYFVLIKLQQSVAIDHVLEWSLTPIRSIGCRSIQQKGSHTSADSLVLSDNFPFLKCTFPHWALISAYLTCWTVFLGEHLYSSVPLLFKCSLYGLTLRTYLKLSTIKLS